MIPGPGTGAGRGLGADVSDVGKGIGTVYISVPLA